MFSQFLCGGNCQRGNLNYFEQQQNEDDGENQADSATAVVSVSGSDSITTISKSEDQNDQKNYQQHGTLHQNLIGFIAVDDTLHFLRGYSDQMQDRDCGVSRFSVCDPIPIA